MLRLYPLLVDAPENLEGAEDAVGAVVYASVYDGVDVGAHYDRLQAWVQALADAEDVADGVDADVEALLLHPGHEEVTCLAVLLAQG